CAADHARNLCLGGEPADRQFEHGMAALADEPFQSLEDCKIALRQHLVSESLYGRQAGTLCRRARRTIFTGQKSTGEGEVRDHYHIEVAASRDQFSLDRAVKQIVLILRTNIRCQTALP